MNQTAYVITSTGNAERVSDARALATQLESFDVFEHVELLPAIFWDDELSVARFLSEYPEHHFEKRYADQALRGQVCCTLSHIKAWRQLLNGDFEGAIISEDDIYVSDEEGFKSIFSKLDEHPELEWLRVHVHKEFRGDILCDKSPLEFVDDFSKWGGAAYWVSRTAAQKLVEQFGNIAAPVDKIIPRLGWYGQLNIKTVNKVVVEHHDFKGDRQDLLARHSREQKASKIQKQASTIYSSPTLTHWDASYSFIMTQKNLQELRRDGITILSAVFNRETVDRALDQVMEHYSLYKNTRPTPSSRHLASFHRYPELESLHGLLAGDRKVRNFMSLVLGGEQARSIGLSDITINRSQHWHTDLLRGKYEHYLNGVDIWGSESVGVYKVLMYLQDGTSLKVIRGSHRIPMSLKTDEYAEPADTSEVMNVPVKAGDVAVMDIRTAHRGSTEEVFLSGTYDDNPKILVSTVLGVDGGKLTDAMEVGNAQRLMDWQARYRDTTPIDGFCAGQDGRKSARVAAGFGASRTATPSGSEFEVMKSELATGKVQLKMLEQQFLNQKRLLLEKLEDKRAKLEASRTRAKTLKAEIEASRTRAKTLEAELKEAATFKTQLEAILGSRSWRIAAPARSIASLARWAGKKSGKSERRG